MKGNPSGVVHYVLLPDHDIEESPGDNGQVKGVHLHPNVSLKLMKIWWVAVDKDLEDLHYMLIFWLS